MARKFSVEAVLEAKDRASPVVRKAGTAVRKLAGDVGQFVKQQVTAATVVGRFTAGVSKLSVGLGATLVGATVAAVVGIVKLVGAIREGITVFAEQERAISRMEAALKGAGEFTQAASREFQAFARAVEASTATTANQALELVTLAKSFGATNEQATKMVATALDVAEATDVEAAGAVRRFGQALQGSGEQLERIVPLVANLTDEELALGAATDLVAEKFGGAATGALKNYTAALENLANAQNRVSAALGGTAIAGEGVTRTITDQAAAWRRLAFSLEANDGAFSKLVGTWRRLKTLGVNLVGTFFDVANSVFQVGVGYETAAQKAELFDQASKSTTAEQRRAVDAAKAAAAALKAEAAAYAIAIRSAEAFGTVTSVQLEAQITDLIRSLELQKEILGENSREYQRLTQTAGAQIEALRNRIESLRDGLGDLQTQTGGAGSAMDAMATSTAALMRSQEAAKRSVNGTTQALQLQERQAALTSAQFDALAASQGRSTAVAAALAAGGRLEQGGTRVTFGRGGGSRLVRPAGSSAFERDTGAIFLRR